MTNVTPSIATKMSSNLLAQPGHPLKRVKDKIYQFFDGFHQRDISDPIVTVKQNFDDLGFPSDHVGRSAHDSYYINRVHMLRTHMTAHEQELILAGHQSFVMAGNVFRRDEIDSTHYPVFHQLEGVNIFNDTPQVDVISPLVKELAAKGPQEDHQVRETEACLAHLQGTVNGLLSHLFGKTTPIRWQECYFPFTHPSMEVEIEYNGKWVEVLGSGLLMTDFLKSSNASSPYAWAFGLGLERLAMILYNIPDIRLFWSTDPRFLSQFDSSISVAGLQFKPFSKYPHIARDISFWIASDSEFSPNAFFDLIRNVAGDIIETVSLVQLV